MHESYAAGVKTPELDLWMELNAAAATAETVLLQRMLKFATFGEQKPDDSHIQAVKELRAAGLEQLDRALAEIRPPRAATR